MRQFPPGFHVTTREDLKRSPQRHYKLPAMTLSKTGYIILNAAATLILAGEAWEKEAVSIAYNAATGTIALRPEKTHLGPPQTYKLVASGAYKRHAAIGFKTLSRIWKIPLSGKHYLCEWDERREIMVADLTRPI